MLSVVAVVAIGIGLLLCLWQSENSFFAGLLASWLIGFGILAQLINLRLYKDIQ
jgi:hypothetical protein